MFLQSNQFLSNIVNLSANLLISIKLIDLVGWSYNYIDKFFDACFIVRYRHIILYKTCRPLLSRIDSQLVLDLSCYCLLSPGFSFVPSQLYCPVANHFIQIIDEIFFARYITRYNSLEITWRSLNEAVLEFGDFRKVGTVPNLETVLSAVMIIQIHLIYYQQESVLTVLSRIMFRLS